MIDVKSNNGDWKTGTEALALCMICGGEYPVNIKECPDCHVSLSMVRRCPHCNRIVSAKHTKCVYCRSSFTLELPKAADSEVIPQLDENHAAGLRLRRFRAMGVSIATFVIVFSLGMAFLREMNKPTAMIHVIAKASVLHSGQLRSAASFSSSIMGTAMPGSQVKITGYKESDQGRWMTLEWNNGIAYLPASELSAPLALDAGNGANVLKFYLDGMEATDSDGAVKAVDAYAKAFPGNEHGEELRWVLAERMRELAQHGGSQGPALRRQANQIFEQLASSKGKFAEKAEDALDDIPSSSARPERRTHLPHVTDRKEDELEVIGGSGTRTSKGDSSPHEALVLTQAEVFVRPGKLSKPAAGEVVTGHVARQIKTNGIVAIPAGAHCELTVVSSDPGGARLSLQLTSIEIDHRVYSVNSRAMEIHSSAKESAPVSFRLNAPLVIER